VPLGGGQGSTELYAADNVNGPYSPEANATVNPGAGTITVPVPSATRFYRIQGSSAVTISNVAIQGANLVLTYE
jgi:hypothetical protein